MKKLKLIIGIVIVMMITGVIALLMNRNYSGGFNTKNGCILYTHERLSNGGIVYVDDSGKIYIQYKNREEYIPNNPFSGIEYYENIEFYCVYGNDIYYSLDRLHENKYCIFKYDTEKHRTDIVYSGKLTNENRVSSLSTNGQQIVICFTSEAKILDISTQRLHRLVKYKDDCRTSISNNYIYYTSENGDFERYSITSATKEKLDNIKAIQYVVVDDTIFYIDAEYDGRLSSYSFENKKYTRYNTEYVISFSEDEYGIYAEYVDGKELLANHFR